MITLYNTESDEIIGTISEEQLQFLIDQLEEESLEDHDYAIEAMLLDYFESQNADPELLTMLRSALGDRDQIVIRWSTD